MVFTPLRLPEVILIEPKIFQDERGFFMECFQQKLFAEQKISGPFVQDNQSGSALGVIRGLHYQAAPRGQGKLVRVLRGAIFDVAVDIRKGSATFGQWVGERLDAQNRRMLYLPPDFAHGFCALEEGTEVLYKTTDFYSAPHDRGVLWDDPEIGIAWPEVGVPYRLSAKDRAQPRLKDIWKKIL